MPDLIGQFLAQRRGQQFVEEEPELESVASLRGTVFDNSDPIAQWRRFNGPKSDLPASAKAIGGALEWATTPIEAIRKPLANLTERSLDWAQEETRPALRYLKAFPGAVAQTVGEMASPAGVASFVSGPVGAPARALLAGEQMEAGAHDIGQGNYAAGAAQMALGAALPAGDAIAAWRAMRAPAGPPPGWTPQSTPSRRGAFRGPIEPETRIGYERALGDGQTRPRDPNFNAGEGDPNFAGYDPYPRGEGGTPSESQGLDGRRRLPAWEEPPFVEGEIIPPGELPPGSGGRFEAGPGGIADLEREVSRYDPNYRRPTNPRQIPERTGEGSLGIPAREGDELEAFLSDYRNSNRALTPQEFLEVGGERKPGPSLAQEVPANDLDEIESFLRREGLVNDAQTSLDGFEIVDDVGGLNASGESAASAEAMSRQAGMKARGEEFGVYDRAGNFRPLIGPDAVDYQVRPGETYGVRSSDGFRVLDDKGGRVPQQTAPPRAEVPTEAPYEIPAEELEMRNRWNDPSRDVGQAANELPMSLEDELEMRARWNSADSQPGARMESRGEVQQPPSFGSDPGAARAAEGGVDELERTLTGETPPAPGSPRAEDDPLSTLARTLEGSPSGELSAPDARGLDKGRSNGGRNRGRGFRQAQINPDEADIVFQRQPREATQQRLTPEVLREIERIRDEMSTFPFNERTWNEVGDKGGNAGGGDFDMVGGRGGASVYGDILGESPLNPSNKRKGQGARRVNGTRGQVAESIARLLETGDVDSNLSEGVLRVAERRARGDYKGLSQPWLPPHWETNLGDIPDDLSNFIDELAASPDEFSALERELAGADVLDTGEVQPRLPEAGSVRELEQGTPEFDAPFSLTAEADKGQRELAQALDFNAPEAEATPQGLQSLEELATRHEVRNPDKAGEIAESMRRVGYKGRPVLVMNDGGKRTAWTATHRLEAAKRAGLKPSDVPMVEFDAARLREAGFDPAQITAGGKKARIKALRAAGLEDAANLLGEELDAAQGRRAQNPRGLPESVPESLPGNVRDFLIRQLKYTPDQVASIGVDEALQIGRDRVVNPNPPAKAGPAPIEPLPERGALPSMESFDQTRQARGLQRRSAVERTAVHPVEPSAAEGAPPPKSAAERQAAGEQLTTRERETLGLPPETRARSTVSLREQGSSPRQIEKRERQLNEWMADPTPENFARWVKEVAGQAERVNAKQLKGGTGESKLPPRGQGGELLASGIFPGAQVFSDPQLLRKLAQFLVSNETSDRLLRGAIGGGVGALTDDDHRLRGGVYGALVGMLGPQVARAVAHDFVLLAKGEVPKGLAEVYDKRPAGDIGPLERIFGTKARTIPEEFAAVRPGVEAFEKIRTTGKVDSRTPLFSERIDTGANAFKDGKAQITQGTFLKPEITYLRKRALEVGEKNPRMGSYLNAYADELAGVMTKSEKVLSELGFNMKAVKRGSAEVANQVYRSGLAFNPGSAVVNRISQPLLTAPYVGLKNLWKAYAPLSEAERGLSDIKLPQDIAEIERPALSALRKFDEFAGWMMRFSDNQNRQGAYAAAHLAAEQTGATPAAAHKFARDVSEKTQGFVGLLSGNPSWRGPVVKMMKPFTKFPILFAEWLNDVATSPDPRVRWRAASMAAGAYAMSQATGIDVWDMLAGGARYGGSAILRAAMDVYNHANNDARDHNLFAMPGKGFLDSDVGNLTYPVGVRKAVETGERFARQGLETHTKRTPGGAVDEVTPMEDLLNMFGIKTTRQTEKQGFLNQRHAEEAAAANEDAQTNAQAKRDFYRAFDSGDTAQQQEALRRMTPATRKNVLKTARRDRYERLLHSTPLRRRGDLRDDYKALEDTLEIR